MATERTVRQHVQGTCAAVMSAEPTLHLRGLRGRVCVFVRCLDTVHVLLGHPKDRHQTLLSQLALGCSALHCTALSGAFRALLLSASRDSCVVGQLCVRACVRTWVLTTASASGPSLGRCCVSSLAPEPRAICHPIRLPTPYRLLPDQSDTSRCQYRDNPVVQIGTVQACACACACAARASTRDRPAPDPGPVPQLPYSIEIPESRSQTLDSRL